MNEQPKPKIRSNYELKEEHVALLPAKTARAGRALSVEVLEEMHSGPAVSASKFGLEAICGASCDTGAQ